MVQALPVCSRNQRQVHLAPIIDDEGSLAPLGLGLFQHASEFLGLLDSALDAEAAALSTREFKVSRRKAITCRRERPYLSAVQQTYGENAERTVVVRLIITSSAMIGTVTELVLNQNRAKTSPRLPGCIEVCRDEIHDPEERPRRNSSKGPRRDAYHLAIPGVAPSVAPAISNLI